MTSDYQVELPSREPVVYYRFGGRAVAWHNNTVLRYLLADHFGSTQAEVSESQAEVGQRRYYVFGSDRTVAGAGDLAREERYTGQRRVEAGGGSARRELYHYGARFYLPGVGIFTQPDTVVPEPKNPQSLNRYSYVLNNPLKYTDPTGHRLSTGDDEGGGGLDGSGSSGSAGEPDQPSFQDTHPGWFEPPPGSTWQDTHPGWSDSPGRQAAGSLGEPLDPGANRAAGRTWGRGNPRTPDYYTITLSAGVVVGVTGQLTVNRYGQVYFGLGGNAGKSFTAISASATGGYLHLFDWQTPTPEEIEGFNSGWCVNVALGAGLGGGVTWNPPLGGVGWSPSASGSWRGWDKSFAAEWGLYSPQGGVSVTHAWRLW